MSNEVYANLLRHVMNYGETVTTRNSTVKRVFPYQVRFEQTPLVSLRKTAWKSAIREMEWFLSGSSRLADLHPSIHPWWEEWADDAGVVRNNYSEQLRCFCGGILNRETDEIELVTVDQVQLLVDGVRNHPFSRRNVITTWNTAEMAHPSTPITNCHLSLLQSFVEPDDNSLHLVTYQRSVDVVCGLPHNWIQAWALLLWLSSVTDRKVGSLTWIGGDVHIYETHFPLVEKMLAIDPNDIPPVPELQYNPTGWDFNAEDFTLSGLYTPVLTDKAEMVV